MNNAYYDKIMASNPVDVTLDGMILQAAGWNNDPIELTIPSFSTITTDEINLSFGGWEMVILDGSLKK
jgi:hypothetical protein